MSDKAIYERIERLENMVNGIDEKLSVIFAFLREQQIKQPARLMNTPRSLSIDIHTPSPYFDRKGEPHDIGRVEAELLHHISAAVYSLMSRNGSTETVRDHMKSVDSLLAQFNGWITALEEAHASHAASLEEPQIADGST